MPESTNDQRSSAEQTGFLAPGQGALSAKPGRAEPPRPPASNRFTEQADSARAEQRQLQEAVESRRIMRGLLALALLVLLGSMLRAGWGRVFVRGWWQQW